MSVSDSPSSLLLALAGATPSISTRSAPCAGTESAFGEILDATSFEPTDWIFPHRAFGEVLDPNLGWTYLRARWMDPEVGRFVSRDPFGGWLTDPASLHAYMYVAADPVNKLDPSGRAFTYADLLVSISIASILVFFSTLMIELEKTNQKASTAFLKATAAAIVTFTVGWLAILNLSTGATVLLASGTSVVTDIVLEAINSALDGTEFEIDAEDVLVNAILAGLTAGTLDKVLGEVKDLDGQRFASFKETVALTLTGWNIGLWLNMGRTLEEEAADGDVST